MRTIPSAPSRHAINASSHYYYRMYQYQVDGGDKVDKQLRSYTSNRSFGANLHFCKHSEVPALIPKLSPCGQVCVSTEQHLPGHSPGRPTDF